MRYESITFDGQEVFLDGNQYVACELRDCTLIFKAESPFTLAGCDLTNCRFRFEGAAALAFDALRGIYHGIRGGQQIVEKTFAQIRQKPG